MSTKTTPYHEKVEQGTRMYGPGPKIPQYPYCLDAEGIKAKYGDTTPVVYYNENGKPIRRSET